MKKLSWYSKISNELWPVTDSQSREPEEMNFSKTYDDIELKRTNPPRYDKRKDWYQSLNENAKDTDVSGRYEQTSLTSGASWHEVLAFNDGLDPAPGFIPTNKGMQTPEDIVDEAGYGSYAANRDYDKTIDPYSDISNPDYDFEKSRLKWRDFWTKHGHWPDEKLDRFERRYFLENVGK